MAEPSPHRALGGERRDHIVRALRSRGAVTVNELAVELGVSTMTVRRDINALAARGLLTRVHGGATLPDPWHDPGRRTIGASSTAQRSRFTIGMVVPQLDYYFPPVVSGARAAALDARARLVVRTTAYDPDEERHQIARLVETPGVDGLIVAPELGGERGVQLLRWLDHLPTPVVLVERRPPAVSPFRTLEWVASDHASGAATAVWHLHGQGHRRIGILTMARKGTTPHLLRGWHDALRALGLPPEEQLQGHTDGFGEPGRAELLAATLADVDRTGTTALLVHSDPYALNLAQFCAEKGVDVPGDLAIVAYDDEVAEFGDPPLTAVRPPKTEVGRQAVETLVARLVEGSRRPAQRVMLDPTLVVRESSVRGA
jgi:DNA-binding LacI/PurR family transcriptional regulator